MLRVISGGPTAVSPELGVAEYLWGHESRIYTVLVARDSRKQPLPILERKVVQDTVLSPAHYLMDPLRPGLGFVVLCETRNLEDRVMKDNMRATLREDARNETEECQWGVHQCFHAVPPRLAEQHLRVCLDSGLMLHSVSIEGDYTVRIGCRGFPPEADPDKPSALYVADHAVLSQHFMQRLGAGETKGGATPPYLKHLTITFSNARIRDSRKNAEVLATKLSTVGVGESGAFPSSTYVRVSARKAHYIELHVDSTPNIYTAFGKILNAVTKGKRGSRRRA